MKRNGILIIENNNGLKSGVSSLICESTNTIIIKGNITINSNYLPNIIIDGGESTTNSSTCNYILIDNLNIECHGCIDGYYLSGDYCAYNEVYNCEKYNYQTKKCEECNIEYHLNDDNSQCLNCSDSCEHCNDSTCLKCKKDLK